MLNVGDYVNLILIPLKSINFYTADNMLRHANNN